MDIKDAVDALSALAQPSRLEVFRRLVRVGPEGLAAGEIARALDVPANTMSAHLAILSRAGLVLARREGRSIIYTADFDGMRDLMTYLMEDCCQGRPELCGIPGTSKAQPSCAPKTKRKSHEALSRPSHR
ncbi:MAG: metalloregulator ArsR/SmtB family transcription factor [Alphaproteobacteria bacterium]